MKYKHITKLSNEEIKTRKKTWFVLFGAGCESAKKNL